MPLPSRLPSRQRSAKEPTKPFDPKAFSANPCAGGTLRHYRPKQAIFSQGERADTVFYIQDGTVRLSVVSTHGKEPIIALLGAGDFLGEGCIASEPVRIATATAVTMCSVLRIENREMLRTLPEEHILGYVCCLRGWSPQPHTVGLGRTWLINCLIRRRSSWHERF